jgi:deoxyribonucleoside regulator
MPNGNDARSSVNKDRFDLLSRVASMYYEDAMTQHEISTRLGYSRSAISRLLTEARQKGVVEIRVFHPLVRSNRLEQRLRQCYDLHDARVLVADSLPYGKMLRRLGELGAQLVEQVVKEHATLAVSWGTSLYEVASALRPPRYPDVTVVQLVGSLGTPDPLIDGPELARWFARLYGGRYQTLSAPLIVESAAVRDALMRDRRVGEVLNRARAGDVAVVGIGSVDPAISSLVRAGYLTVEEIDEVAACGAVGDVCAIHFDEWGNLLLDIPISQRVVGVEAEVLRQIPLVLGVAGGEVKARAVLGALRSGLINALVTDDAAAQRVLELDGR